MFKSFFIAAGATALFSGMASAQGFTDGWSGEASLNASNTSGNTDTTDIGGGLKIAKEGDVWRHKFDAVIDYGEVDGSKNKNRWAVGYQIDRDLNERTYLYANADYYQDDFGAYKDGYFTGAGLGYKAVLPDPVSWNLEAGAGYRSQKLRLAPGTPGGEASRRESGLGLRGFSDFDYALNDNVSFFNDTEVLWTSDDTYIWNEVGLTAQLIGNLAARASFRVDHHTDVEPGFKKTDTATRLGIVYTIK